MFETRINSGMAFHLAQRLPEAVRRKLALILQHPTSRLARSDHNLRAFFDSRTHTAQLSAMSPMGDKAEESGLVS